MRKSIIVVLILIGFLILVVVNLDFLISRNHAFQLAESALEEYKSNYGFSLVFFKLEAESSELNYPWIFDYRAIAEQKHLVRIYVDCYGFVELHRFIE